MLAKSGPRRVEGCRSQGDVCHEGIAGLVSLLVLGSRANMHIWTLLPRQPQRFCLTSYLRSGFKSPMTDSSLTRGSTRAPLSPQMPYPGPGAQLS